MVELLEKRKHDNNIYTLTSKSLFFIIFYYSLYLIVGILTSIYIMTHLYDLSNNNLMLYTIIISISISGMLCSVQYLKRIYKACIENRVNLSVCEQKQILYGNILYFIFRPIYAFVFVILVILVLRSGLIIMVSSLDNIMNDRFLYLCVIVSSIIGFSIGKILDSFEILSNARVKNVLRNLKEDSDVK